MTRVSPILTENTESVLRDCGAVSNLHQVVELQLPRLMRVSPMLRRGPRRNSPAPQRRFPSTAWLGLTDLFPVIAVARQNRSRRIPGAILQDGVVTQSAVFAYHSVGMREKWLPMRAPR